jgi:YfiH family protein
LQAHHKFTDRSGGVSGPPFDTLNLGGHVGDDPAAVAENRRLVAADCGLAPERLLFMRQVHGCAVAVADEPWPANGPPEADGMVTAQPATALAVLVADCVPVLLADEAAGVIGAAHAGRAGLVRGVVPVTLERMAAFGAQPADTKAYIGPAICGRCYEVPQDLHDAVVAAIPAARSITRWGAAALDIPAGVEAQLRRHGVGEIERAQACTLEDPRLFSYRRQQQTGRFAGLVWLEP